MISFIVIGRNEGWKLGRCLESVTHAASQFRDAEIIYVDSQSTDGSLELAANYPAVSVFLITGPYNAAIARNIGVKESSGEVLFFIDGDMEIDAAILKQLYDEQRGLIHEFVSANWVDYNYETASDQTPISKHKAKKVKDAHYDFRVGGLFLTTRAIWEASGGMRNKLRRNQDFDLAVRLAKRGIFLLRTKEVLAIHHTTSPRHNLRKMWTRGLSGASFYRMVSLRDNILNKYQWHYFLRTSYTFLVFWAVLLAAVLSMQFSLLLIYVVSIALRSMLRRQLKPLVFISNMLLTMFNDVLFLFAFLFFWPKQSLALL